MIQQKIKELYQKIDLESEGTWRYEVFEKYVLQLLKDSNKPTVSEVLAYEAGYNTAKQDIELLGENHKND